MKFEALGEIFCRHAGVPDGKEFRLNVLSSSRTPRPPTQHPWRSKRWASPPRKLWRCLHNESVEGEGAGRGVGAWGRFIKESEGTLHEGTPNTYTSRGVVNGIFIEDGEVGVL